MLHLSHCYNVSCLILVFCFVKDEREWGSARLSLGCPRVAWWGRLLSVAMQLKPAIYVALV